MGGVRRCALVVSGCLGSWRPRRVRDRFDVAEQGRGPARAPAPKPTRSSSSATGRTTGRTSATPVELRPPPIASATSPPAPRPASRASSGAPPTSPGSAPAAPAARGSVRLLAVRSRPLRATVEVALWGPDGVRDGVALPLLVVHDGPEYDGQPASPRRAAAHRGRARARRTASPCSIRAAATSGTRRRRSTPARSPARSCPRSAAPSRSPGRPSAWAPASAASRCCTPSAAHPTRSPGSSCSPRRSSCRASTTWRRASRATGGSSASCAASCATRRFDAPGPGDADLRRATRTTSTTTAASRRRCASRATRASLVETAARTTSALARRARPAPRRPARGAWRALMERRHVELWAPGIDAHGVVVAYGHFGRPVLVFPTERGRAWEYENRGMVARRRRADRGRAGSSSTASTPTTRRRGRTRRPARGARPRARPLRGVDPRPGRAVDPRRLRRRAGDRHDRLQPRRLPRRELRPQARRPLPARALPVGQLRPGELAPRAGASAATQTYFNSPIDYVAQPRRRPPRLAALAREPAARRAARACGRTRPARSTARCASPSCCGDKGIRHELDLWGHDVPHDWPSWRAQIAHHLPRFC